MYKPLSLVQSIPTPFASRFSYAAATSQANRLSKEIGIYFTARCINLMNIWIVTPKFDPRYKTPNL